MAAMDCFVPRKDSVDAATRERIAAWLEYKIQQRNLKSKAAVAQIMGVSAAAVSRVLSRDRTPGLDFVLAMFRKLHIPIEDMLEQMPPSSAVSRTQADEQ